MVSKTVSSKLHIHIFQIPKEWRKEKGVYIETIHQDMIERKSVVVEVDGNARVCQKRKNYNGR